MDPFSISAGILTILGATTSAFKAARIVFRAEKDFIHLASDLEIIQLIVDNIHELVESHPSPNPVLNQILEKTQAKILDAKTLIDNCHRKPNSDELSLRAWLRHRSKAETLRQDLKEMKHDLSTGLVLMLNTYVCPETPPGWSNLTMPRSICCATAVDRRKIPPNLGPLSAMIPGHLANFGEQGKQFVRTEHQSLIHIMLSELAKILQRQCFLEDLIKDLELASSPSDASSHWSHNDDEILPDGIEPSASKRSRNPLSDRLQRKCSPFRLITMFGNP
jgi:hypothetical protein